MRREALARREPDPVPDWVDDGGLYLASLYRRVREKEDEAFRARAELQRVAETDERVAREPAAALDAVLGRHEPHGQVHLLARRHRDLVAARLGDERQRRIRRVVA